MIDSLHAAGVNVWINTLGKIDRELLAGDDLSSPALASFLWQGCDILQTDIPLRLRSAIEKWRLTGPPGLLGYTNVVPRPKLVVGIMVDQMRWDYIYRYYNRFGTGGFRRLLRDGFANDNAYIEHVPTVTAIGHSCVYTGSVPAIHGITGNNFIDRGTGREFYCAADSTVQILGDSKAEGRSPENLRSSTIGDELKLATNFRSRVIGVAFKDRSSIFPAGRMADAAYWIGNAGAWTSSSYYMHSLPQWVQDFNDKGLPLAYLKLGWQQLLPADEYGQSSPDSNAYEGGAFGRKTAALPYSGEELLKQGAGAIYGTPYGNAYTLDFCREVISKEKLGNNPAQVPDLLAVSLSSTDALGHRVGTHAVELEDMYIRLDRDLADFFLYLDQTIGNGKYLVFLTADHGASHNNHFLADHKGGFGFVPGDDSLQRQLNRLLQVKFKQKNLVTAITNNQVHLNQVLLKQGMVDENAVKAAIIAFLEDMPGKSFVVDSKTAAGATMPDLLKKRITNSYYHRRSGDIFMVDEPQYKTGDLNSTGTGHSDWNPYDSHIPLLWMGWNIRPGASHEKVAMYDIAPTVAALLHIQEPNGCVGKPIVEVLPGPNR